MVSSSPHVTPPYHLPASHVRNRTDRRIVRRAMRRRCKNYFMNEFVGRMDGKAGPAARRGT